MTTPSSPDIMIVSALVINPGDTLVVATHERDMMMEDLQEIREHIMKELPGVNVLMIAGADITKIVPTNLGGN